MGSVLNISGVYAAGLTLPPVPKVQQAPSTLAAPAQPTVTQLLEEPLFQLREQAQAGYQLAIEVLAQDQALTPPQAPVAGAALVPGAVDLLA